MRKVFTILVLLLMAMGQAFAAPIGGVKAREMAERFAVNKGKTLGAEVSSAKGKGGVQNDTASYYVFNLGAEEGFVIISGDDRVESVLGYADKGSMTDGEMPDGLKYMLSIYEQSLKAMDAKGLISVERKTLGEEEGEENNGNEDEKSVSPLVNTHWGQGFPYNLKCPLKNGVRCLTGCVATATAQVMACYAVSKETFDWENMLLQYSGVETTEEQQNAVAELMAYIGKGVDAEYGVDGTGASTFDVVAFLREEGYPSTMFLHNTMTNMEKMLHSELGNGRPVIISGQGFEGGHAFICDGYSNNGYFHINWGWEGYCDGYYRIGALAPYNLPKADGSISPIGDYSSGLGMVVAMAPEEIELPEYSYVRPVYSDGDITVTMDKPTVTEVALNSTLPYRVTIDATGGDYRGTLSLSVKNGNGTTSTLEYGIDVKEGESLTYVIGIKMAVLGECAISGKVGRKSLENINLTVVDRIVVELTEPGTLGEKMAGMSECNSLKISGPMNGDDFLVLQRLLNVGSGMIYTKQHVDLEEAWIVAGGENGMVTKDNELPDQVFNFAINLYSIVLPNTLERLGSNSLAQCLSLADLQLPESLKEVGAFAMRRLSLEEIILPDNVRIIEQQAFVNCASLKRLHLSKSLEVADVYFINGLTSLEEIELPAKTPPAYAPGFYGYGLGFDVSKCKLYVPMKSAEAYKNHEIWGQFDVEGRYYYVPGDANGDGLVTKDDAALVTAYFLGMDDVTIDTDAADVDEDGQVTVSDANAIINMCLGK